MNNDIPNEAQWFCPHVGGFGPPFQYCEICTKETERLNIAFDDARKECRFDIWDYPEYSIAQFFFWMGAKAMMK